MRKMMLWRSCLVLSIALILSGCLLSDDDGCGDTAGLRVTISASDTTTSSSDPVVITVRAENLARHRIVFGHGSSSCQLGSFVRMGKNNYFIPDSRICTDDMAPQVLGPGESRTESWIWEGEIWKNQKIEDLPPGRYRVHGAAGLTLSRNSVVIEVLRP